MNSKSLSRAVACSLLVLAAPAIGQPLCKPELVIKDVRFSQMVGVKRYWWATIEVDAAKCVEYSGRFQIDFVRAKEIGKDVAFSEVAGWQKGATDVVVEFGADEAVHEYRIGVIAPCTCRR